MANKLTALRGRRPRRAGTWGYRAMQLVTQSLAPTVVAFLRRPVVRSKTVYMRQIKQRGMAVTAGSVGMDAVLHPGIRRGKLIRSRWIVPADVGL